MVAAIEQFLRDTAPPAAAAEPARTPGCAPRGWRPSAPGPRRAAVVSEVAVLDHDAVLAAVSPAAAIEHVRAAFVAHHAGEWTMPAKVYLAVAAPRRLPRHAGARRRASRC